jgi:DNA-binding transcriptional LysR family regulator
MTTIRGRAAMRDLNDLQLFAAVVGQSSISSAARLLGVSKSRVSRRIALLEERLGVRLFERSTRSLSVTDAGQQVYEHARAVIDQADAVEDVALRMRAEPRGLVRISCPHGLQPSIFERLPALLAAHPLLRVQVITTNRRVDLIEEGIDIALRVRERIDTEAGVQSKKIGLSKKILVAAPQFLAQLAPPSKPADLRRYPLLHQQEQSGPSVWTLTNGTASEETVEFQPRLASGDYGILVSAACAGIGVALLPSGLCKGELASGQLVQVLSEWSAPVGIVHLVFTSRRAMLPAVRTMVDFVAQSLRIATE